MVEQNTLEIIETVSQMNIKNGLIFLKSYLQYITLKKKYKSFPSFAQSRKDIFLILSKHTLNRYMFNLCAI